jgi:glycine/D-amino acid oxidase-like deaminating enzyme
VKKIVIIGAGIIGASFAYYLARQGADVTLLDSQQSFGGVATPNSWAWINASWGNSEKYVQLRLRSIKEWHALASVSPELGVNWCGSLSWDLPEADLKAYASQRSSQDYALELVGPDQISKMEPALAQPPSVAVHAKNEGMIEPARAVQGFVEAAKAQGAKFYGGVEVLDFIVTGNRITGIQTSEDKYFSDEVIVAAGVQSKAMLKLVGFNLALDSIPGLLVHTAPLSGKLNGMVLAPKLHARQTAEGRLVIGSDFGGLQPDGDPAATAQLLFKELGGFLRGAEKLKLEFHAIGHRPTPSDGLPAIGRVAGLDGLYLAVMHSGITLAPIVGRLGSEEILTGLREPSLTDYDPNRLIS